MSATSLPSTSSRGAAVRESRASAVGTDLVRQFLVFRLGTESFAIPIGHVREIIEFNGLTTIPMMPSFLRGVLNLRGAVVPVIDLQARFGRGETIVAKRTCVVIVEVVQEAKNLIGVMVDAVSEVISVGPSEVESKPTFGTKIRSDFVDGILNLKDRFVVTLDVDNVLSIEEMASLIGIQAGNGILEDSTRS